MSCSRRKATTENTARKRLQVEHLQRPPILLKVLSASRKKSETTSLAAGELHCYSGHGSHEGDALANSCGSNVTVCASTLRGHCHKNIRGSPELCDAYVCASMFSCVCLRLWSSLFVFWCVRVCVSACLSVLQDTMLEVLILDESRSVLGKRCRMFCLTTTRPEGLELKMLKV